jgi:serine/threonine protein kinase
MAIPSNPYSRCTLHDIFNEILILETLKGSSNICRLYDYGVDDEFYYIIMKEYKCSLKFWRGQQKNDLNNNLMLYMEIFYRVLLGVKMMTQNNICHFDLKCDNIFLEPFDDVSEEDFWNQPSNIPNFKIVIGDFGESNVYSSEEDTYMFLRGTDCIKSPEMLKIDMLKITSKSYDRRKRVGATTASDMWSLGCLLYELLTNEFLFNSPNFFVIITDESFPVISQERYKLINYNPILNDILIFILVRDQEMRPSVDDIINFIKTKFSILYNKLSKTEEKPEKIEEKESEIKKIENVKKVEDNLISNQNMMTPHFSLKDNKENNYEKFYVKSISVIFKDKIYLSSEDINNKTLKILGITHLVNCSGVKSKLDDSYITFLIKESIDKVPSTKKQFSEYMEAFEFVKNAIIRRGRVLIYSNLGLSRSAVFAISYIHYVYNISSYESYILLSKIRPAIKAEIFFKYLNFLNIKNFPQPKTHSSKEMNITAKNVQSWVEVHYPLYLEKIKKSKKFNIMNSLYWFRCLCGSCLVGVPVPFTKLDSENKELDKDLIKGWPTFLDEMNILYSLEITEMKYVFSRKTRCFLNEFNLQENVIKHENDNDKSWSIFKCKYCNFIIYSIKNNYFTEAENPQQSKIKLNINECDLAVNTILKEFLHVGNESKIMDLRPNLFFKSLK